MCSVSGSFGDPGLLSTVPTEPELPYAEPRIAPEVAARALYGALAAAVSVPVGAGPARTVHQTSTMELVRVLGHRCPKRLGRR